MSADPKQPLSRVMDEAEPTAGQTAIPIWLIILFTLLAYWGMLYLDNHAGGFNAEVYPPFKSYQELVDDQPKSAGDEQVAKGKKIFNNACIVCHQATGLGTPGQFPPLAGSDWVANPVPNRIIRIVLNGATGPITVKGMDFNNTMVPWKDTFKDDEIAAVLTFVRQNKDWGNNAPAVTAAQVKAIREKIKDKTDAFTADELLKLGDGD